VTYTPPTLRATGDLITADAWNDEVAANITHLHQREATLCVTPLPGDGWTTDIVERGRWTGVRWDANSTDSGDGAAFPFFLPADFATLVSAYIYAACTQTTTVEYDLQSRFATPDVDLLTAGGSQSIGLTQNFTADQLTTIDATTLLSGVAAGQVGSLKLRASAGSAPGNMFAFLCVITYTRT
jgi:hypothetical protein